MAEEERISPAVVIAGLGLGLVAAVGIAALAMAAPPKAGTILDAKWRETGTEEWHSFPLSVPGDTPVDIKWRVRNNSDYLATFTTGIISLDRYRLYPQTLTTIEPGKEADLITEGIPGSPSGESGSQTFYLAVLPGEVTSTYEPDWYEAELVDSVTLEYSWY